MNESAVPSPDVFRSAWFLTGPTAAGKTAVGLELASRLGGEIIAMDSMTVYTGMDIGTAKPTVAEREVIPHHLIDLVPPTAEFSISQYLTEAGRAVQDIEARGKTPIFVGGTPLYLRALLRGMDQGPPPDPEFRAEVLREVERVGPQALHERLSLVDPLAAARIHPHDVKRMIRALEVFQATGAPISHRQRHFDEPPLEAAAMVFSLDWPRPMLHERINRRVSRMFEAGFVDEVRGLLDRYGELGKTAAQAVGYREVLQYLAGEQGLEPTVAAVQTRTRRFARRQLTWLRAFEELKPVPAAGLEPDQLAEQILAAAEQSA